MLWSRSTLFGVVLALAPGAAGAEAGEVFGLGSQAAGRGNGGYALQHTAWAPGLNPAAVAMPRYRTFAVAAQVGGVHLNPLQGVRSRADPDAKVPEDGVAPGYLGLGSALRLGGPVSLGWSLALPWQGFYSMRSHDPWIPFAARWSNRAVSMAAHFALAGRIVDGLWIGLGIDVLPRASVELDLRLQGDGGEGGEPSTDPRPFAHVDVRELALGIGPVVRPRAGVIFDFGAVSERAAGLRLAVGWSEPMHIRIEPVHLNLEGSEVGQLNSLFNLADTVQATANLMIADHFRPRRFHLGLAGVRRRGSIYVDLRYNRWSSALPSVGRLVDGQGDNGFYVEFTRLDGEILVERYPLDDGRSLGANPFRDTLTLRVGGEWRPRPLPLRGAMRSLALALRAGYTWDPAYVRPDPGPATLLDGDHHLVAFGLGLSSFDPWALLGGPFSVDLAGSYLRVVGVTVVKEPEGWPTVPEHTATFAHAEDNRFRWTGGHAWALSVSLTLRH
jgi:hypothetical protein